MRRSLKSRALVLTVTLWLPACAVHSPVPAPVATQVVTIPCPAPLPSPPEMQPPLPAGYFSTELVRILQTTPVEPTPR